jgi:hypothetical protein
MARTFRAIAAVTLGLASLSCAHAVVPSLKQPNWVELTPGQRQILAPLSGEWDKLESWRRKKWIGIAQRYPALNPDEQARVEKRMKAWVVLSPDERKAAREKFKKLQHASPEHKEALKQKWQEYKELPAEEKLRLQRQASRTQPPPIPAVPAAVPAVPAAARPAAPPPAAVEPAAAVVPSVPPALQ